MARSVPSPLGLLLVGLGVVIGDGRPARAAEGPGLAEHPLAPRSVAPGTTLFTVLPPAQTGVHTENNFTDPRMWWERYHEFEVGAIGTGVAIGDYDGDGRPDLYVVSKTEPNRLFRNLGDWRFEDVTARAGVAGPVDEWKQAAAFVDVDNDGRLDLYVTRFNAPNLLYMNQGDGSFREEAERRGLALRDACGVAAFCDYDRDGWLDVYLQTNLLDSEARPNGQPDRLFRNNGDGTFAETTERAGIRGDTQGHSATWWDFDEDGWPDLYVANDFETPDTLYRNNGDGTFTDALDRTVPHTPYSSMGSDVGDVNNDGRIDLFVADMAATTAEKDQRGMAVSRARAKEDPSRPGVAPQYPFNALYLNTGTPHCLEAAHLTGLPASDWMWSPRFEDLDNDGRLDLHLTNGMVRELHNDDILARMMAAESVADRIRTMRESPVLAERNLAFRNRGDLQFEEVSAAWGLDQTGVSFGSAFGDFDGDGDLDLVFTNYQAGATLLRNDSPAGHRVTIALRGARSNRFGYGALVRLETARGVQVRPLVQARGYLSSSEPIVHFGLGDESVIRRLTVEWPSGARQEWTQLPADRAYTITEPAAGGAAEPAASAPAGAPLFVAHAATGLEVVAREEVIDETAAQPLLPLRRNRAGPGLVAADLDGDGRDEILVGGTTRDPRRVFRAEHGRWRELPQPAWAAPAVLNDGPLAVFDGNGDGAPDCLATKAGVTRPAGSPDFQPELFLNDGRGHFAAAPAGTLPAAAVCAGAVAVADFDRDGRLDVFIGSRGVPGRYPLPGRSVLLLNRGGRFDDASAALPDLAAAGLVNAALATDVDRDGWPDLLVAGEWGGVRFLHNEGGRGFSDRSEAAGFAAAGTGWWTSLAAADFNGDGRLDYVAGNVGLNTVYQATAERPVVLYLGDFKGGGPPQIVEGFYEGDRLLPRRARKQLLAAVPSIKRRFPKNDDFARATLGEIVGEDRLAAAKRFAAGELRSGAFLSQADGTYRFAPLPRLAQIAPLQGMVTGDFDGDGRMDVYAVQNSYAPIPSVGRFDGGLSQLLLGDGRGAFAAVEPAASGLVVRGDAKALVTLDPGGEGRPGFVATRNNDTLLEFRRAAGGHFVAVVLRGSAGNPTGLGALVTAEYADGSTASAELGSTAGYASQNGGTLWFGQPAGREIVRFRVRWPDGRSTEHAGPFAGSRVEFSQAR